MLSIIKDRIDNADIYEREYFSKYSHYGYSHRKILYDRPSESSDNPKYRLFSLYSGALKSNAIGQPTAAGSSASHRG
jgi:hypothetical protein